ncbi:MAG: 50S ribosomal protein L6 [Candidatus Absconditabacteria bacterium]|nr:50S ribosomal protein L6 [Candidatus Absconditabacteria bacterium]MDD3868418.1 50S ribosomal protein L6 [Candidatus Absconditabacteria bacterium]MDD4714058.1 50S ribosomal protein L6 [Candidatus Absconditabacteria bacterium]
MSKIGRKVIVVPEGVEVVITGAHVAVKGAKGSLEWTVPAGVSVKMEGNEITTSITNDEHKNLWGLSRTLINNMIIGVKEGYEKKLLIIGVGFGAQVSGNQVVFSLGYAHKVNFPIPQGIEVKAEQDPKGNTVLTISGYNKELVGEVAAKMRLLRKPEPYKGKGIRYFDEFVKLKAGKSAKK